MGSAASSLRRSRLEASAIASDEGQAQSNDAATADGTSATAPLMFQGLVVVEGRYSPYPGVADPTVQWVSSGAGDGAPASSSSAAAAAAAARPATPRAASDSSGAAVTATPQASYGVAPTEAVSIPYTPEGGYPPVSLLQVECTPVAEGVPFVCLTQRSGLFAR